MRIRSKIISVPPHPHLPPTILHVWHAALWIFPGTLHRCIGKRAPRIKFNNNADQHAYTHTHTYAPSGHTCARLPGQRYDSVLTAFNLASGSVQKREIRSVLNHRDLFDKSKSPYYTNPTVNSTYPLVRDGLHECHVRYVCVCDFVAWLNPRQ